MYLFLFRSYYLSRDGEKNIILITTNPWKVLRNFGHMIKNFRVNFSRIQTKLCTEIENYLAIYCSDSLQRLTMTCNTSKIALKDLQKPLENVTYLKIIITTDYESIEHIQFLNESYLPNLNEIEIFSNCLYFFEQSSKKLIYDNIESFTYWAWRERIYPLSFGKLKHLTTAANCQVNDAFCECIGNIKDLKTLKILSTMFLSNSERKFGKMLELPKILSNLEELQFEYSYSISLNDILPFVKNNQSLRKLSIHMDTTDNFVNINYLNFLETISSNLGIGWKFHTSDILHKNEYYYCANICYVAEKIIDI